MGPKVLNWPNLRRIGRICWLWNSRDLQLARKRQSCFDMMDWDWVRPIPEIAISMVFLQEELEPRNDSLLLVIFSSYGLFHGAEKWLWDFLCWNCQPHHCPIGYYAFLLNLTAGGSSPDNQQKPAFVEKSLLFKPKYDSSSRIMENSWIDGGTKPHRPWCAAGWSRFAWLSEQSGTFLRL